MNELWSPSRVCPWTITVLNPYKRSTNAIKYSVTKHFADDTNLLLSDYSLKSLQKHLNLDLM